MAPLRAKIIISFILLLVLLMLPDEATSQRRRRGMIASNTVQDVYKRQKQTCTATGELCLTISHKHCLILSKR